MKLHSVVLEERSKTQYNFTNSILSFMYLLIFFNF